MAENKKGVVVSWIISMHDRRLCPVCSTLSRKIDSFVGVLNKPKQFKCQLYGGGLFLIKTFDKQLFVKDWRQNSCVGLHLIVGRVCTVMNQTRGIGALRWCDPIEARLMRNRANPSWRYGVGGGAGQRELSCQQVGHRNHVFGHFAQREFTIHRQFA